jgi:hypothetical protein
MNASSKTNSVFIPDPPVLRLNFREVTNTDRRLP